jgi:ubiquinone biosynthesis protein COQ9
MALIRSSFKRDLNPCRISRSAFGIKSCYHSYDHPSPPPYSGTANAILSAAISHIPSHGFGQTALQLGAKDAGYLPISTNLFPRGPFELVLFYLVSRRLALKDLVNGEEGLAKVWAEKKFGPGRKVRDLLLERLRMNAKAGVVNKLPEVSTQRTIFLTD